MVGHYYLASRRAGCSDPAPFRDRLKRAFPDPAVVWVSDGIKSLSPLKGRRYNEAFLRPATHIGDRWRTPITGKGRRRTLTSEVV